MASPSVSVTTLRPELAGSFMAFDMEGSRRGFIAGRALRPINTMKKSGVHGKIPLNELLRTPQTKRAPKSGYARDDFQWETASFACEEHGMEGVVDDEEAAMYRDYLDVERLAAMRAVDAVLRRAEIDASDTLFNTTTWTGSALTTAITNEWDDHTNAVPLDDVLAAKVKVFEGIGEWPNALILPKSVFLHLRECAQVLDRLKYSGFKDPTAANVNEDVLAQVFDLRHILVAGAAKNSAIEGQTATPVEVWSDEYAMVAKVAETDDIAEPCVGRSYLWDEIAMQGADGPLPWVFETYDEAARRGSVVRARNYRQFAVLFAQAAHLLSNVSTN